jgi:hypothetical protein
VRRFYAYVFSGKALDAELNAVFRVVRASSDGSSRGFELHSVDLPEGQDRVRHSP